MEEQATKQTKKLTKKKIWIIVGAVLALILLIALIGGGDEDTQQPSGSVDKGSTTTNQTLGDYSVEIKSCRLAKDYEKKPVVIVKYVFTNNNDEDGEAFYLAFEDKVYQNGVGLNSAYVLDDSANYSSDNQMKEIKKGASIEVEVAYVLNDTTTDILVEVSELWSWSDKKTSKTFSIK